MNSKLIQIKEAAEVLGVSKLTLRNWDKAGKLVAFRHPINNYRVYKREDIERIIKDMSSLEKTLNKPKSPTSSKPKVYTLKVKHLLD